MTPADLWQQARSDAADGDRSTTERVLRQAWDESRSPFERCLSAHHLATTSADPRDALHWARTCVQWAAETEPAAIIGVLPQIYLSLATAYRSASDVDTARTYFLRAADACDEDTDVVVGGAITTGLIGTGFVPRGLSDELIDLIEALVARRSLGALAVLLPAVLSGAVSDGNVARLAAVLDEMFWTPGLVDDDLSDLTRLAAAQALVQLADDDAAVANASASAPVGAGASAASAHPPVVTHAADAPAPATDPATAAQTDDVPFRI